MWIMPALFITVNPAVVGSSFGRLLAMIDNCIFSCSQLKVALDFAGDVKVEIMFDFVDDVKVQRK